MDIQIIPRPLSGTVSVQSSKSELQRMIICAASADAPTRIGYKGGALSEDVLATVRCVAALGADIEVEDKTITVSPVSGFRHSAVLDCGQSAATLRFMLPVAACLCEDVTFAGGGSLARRPVADLLEALKKNGLEIESDRIPVRTRGLLRGGRFSVSGNISSQYLSGLLLASPLMKGGAEIELTTGLVSSGYVMMTRSVMNLFGAQVSYNGTFSCHAQGYRSPGAIQAGGDWSGAAALIASAACGSGCDIVLEGLDAGSEQKDREVTAILGAAGADIRYKGFGVRIISSSMRAFDADLSDMPDLFPVLACASVGACGTSRFYGCERLRVKESDRIESVSKALGAFGYEISDGGGCFSVIRNGSAPIGVVDPSGDHRVVMAAVVASYASGIPVTIRNCECVSKSYPGFFECLRELGGEADVL